jgi:hypothetical protein
VQKHLQHLHLLWFSVHGETGAQLVEDREAGPFWTPVLSFHRVHATLCGTVVDAPLGTIAS